MGPKSRRVRTVVADDSRTALRSICKYLEVVEEFEIVGTARDGLDAVAKVKHLRPELVLLDLSMPRMSGLEAARELKKIDSDLRIVIFTELSGLSLREECLRRGADGFLEKGEIPEKLLEEIRRLFPMDS
jgi:DNA-binding NarL/FixJ family response regulator